VERPAKFRKTWRSYSGHTLRAGEEAKMPPPPGRRVQFLPTLEVSIHVVYYLFAFAASAAAIAMTQPIRLTNLKSR